jgi:hypothetical protein
MLPAALLVKSRVGWPLRDVMRTSAFPGNPVALPTQPDGFDVASSDCSSGFTSLSTSVTIGS